MPPAHPEAAAPQRKTVLVALAANLGIAVAKLIAGVLGGSSAMLAEAAHSVADSTNQLFLLGSLHFAERGADEMHPFGHGKERFLWSFMAAIFIFVAGALFSLYEGISKLLHGSGEDGKYGLLYAVLVVALVLEGISLARALRQTKADAERSRAPLARYLRTSRDPTTKTVVFEDSAAVIGVVLAIIGVGLHQATGSPVPDAIAAILIGLLLAAVAAGLWRDTRSLLIGEAALPEERKKIYDVLQRHPQVEKVVELLTMAMGPDDLLVAARIDLADNLDSDAVERLATELERELREAVPAVKHVFLHPTHRHAAAVSATT
jgi:cation diffusion facilitator family transporter